MVGSAGPLETAAVMGTDRSVDTATGPTIESLHGTKAHLGELPGEPMEL